ncbi:CaiB/BaiF CoA transferase family protein [Cupriavidus numazuensis]|uniref:Succinyl-CoA--L-malate CoA-transferase alpha subunit n=1 Tax=Cupriavidus numazuensis TaxID=221992 RepID=A0ABN7QFH7_9BURK|nr:CaiB/BaiF CoA-transferase family protein [Cupriavidus numazuensis]CAG2160129.1 Succinyl-CoA--L-malate CoA-transferase alpha subunit [Cupriavidus numazuensis]
MSILQGVRVVEIAGIGPGPFCGMLLADLGADVIVIERPGPSAGGARPAEVVHRGKRSIVLDLKQPGSAEVVLRLLDGADALIEGMRPGVMERLGLGPEVCLGRRPSLVYGRMTGWGQSGPLAQVAGHDSNYTALSGALWYASPPGEAPVAPPTLVGDVGGALYLAVGLLAGILRARESGQGDVVDAAIVDTSAHMMNLLFGVAARSGDDYTRGGGTLDGAHWAHSYRCADGRWINVAALEPQFYGELMERLGLAGDTRFAAQMQRECWPDQRRALAEVFATKPRDAWCRLFEGTDACFAPVNDPGEAARHPHMAARATFTQVDGVLQAVPAPRFARDARRGVAPVPAAGQHTVELLAEAGFSAECTQGLLASGVARDGGA